MGGQKMDGNGMGVGIVKGCNEALLLLVMRRLLLVRGR